MDLIKSIIMGMVQGLTEFLPVSSDGHLAIMRHILHMETGLQFDVLLHLGTLTAVIIAFWKDVWELIVEAFKMIGDFFANLGRMIKNISSKNKAAYKQVISTPYRRFVMLIIVATIPTGIIGILLKDIVPVLSETLLVPGLCLILTGLLLSIADITKSGNKTEANASYKDAGLIGIAQGLAVLPGLSRSGSTITSSLIAGFDRNFAVKYSFIMSIPAILGATVLEFKDFSMDVLTQNQLLNYLIGTIVAGVVGFICIKIMLVVVRKKKFKYFAYYCFAIGILGVAAYFIKK